jgi:indole-3-glycerol phosphate synthase
MSSILNTIVETVRKNIEVEKVRISPARMRRMAERGAGHRGPAFEAALKKSGMSIIAEVKKASPSRGVICNDFDPLRIAKAYHLAGADAISILTESTFFQGHSDYLKQISRYVSTPLLCKDFIIDRYQIDQAAVNGAGAVLLIAAVLNDKELNAYLDHCAALQLAALVEVHDKKELCRALDSTARIIGVNNRNLHTLEVSLQTGLDLVSLIPATHIRVSESGIFNSRDVLNCYRAGFDAVLVGESLMRQADPGRALQKLRGVECG